MADYTKLQARCQRGEGRIADANNLLAECYGALGRLIAENERLEAQVRLAGVAGEMAVHEAVGRAATDFGVAVMERDRLKAENEALRKSIRNIDDSLWREYWSEYAGLDGTRAILDAALSKGEQP